jgi:hypothetical protein
MKIVKVSSGSSRLSPLLLRQTPNSLGIWGDCRFFVNRDVDSCDAWFVLHHSGLIRQEKTCCDPTNIFYLSMEPYESIGNVTQDFIQQFSTAIGCDPALTGTTLVHHKNIHTWWAGIRVEHQLNSHRFLPKYILSYDDFLEQSPNPESSRLDRICCILSDKTLIKGHHDRLALVQHLSTLPVGEYIDFYGSLGTPFLDKYEVQSRYKYSLVFENAILQDYWTEKLADTFLSSSFPFYWGCPNIADYFSADSSCLLNSLRPAQISDVICAAINDNLYSERLLQIDSARLLVLNRYNVFNEMAQLVETCVTNFKKPVCIKPNVYYSESPSQRLRRRLSLVKRALAFQL